MLRYMIVTAVAVTAFSGEAWATNPGNNGNGNGNGGCGVGQQTNGCGGGAGGSATSSATAAAIAAQQQRQTQGQQQSSRNTNSNVANGGNAQGGASNANGGSASSNQSQGIDNSGAGSNSNNYNQSGIPVSSAVAPSFAIGGCQWAVSGGIQFFGTGVSGGGAGMYEFCKSLMKSKHFIDQGNPSVAKALECQDSGIRAAYKTAGQPCAEDMPRVAAAPVASRSTLPQNCTEQSVGGKTFITCK